MSVLAVHETAAMRQLVLRSLRSFDGVEEVEVVTSFDEAMELLQGRQFDCILSDWEFAGGSMNGLEFLQVFRAAGWTMPFVLATPSADRAVHRAATESGADFVLVKPFVGEELAKAVGLDEGDPASYPSAPVGAESEDVLAGEVATCLSQLCGAAVSVRRSDGPVDEHRHRYVASYHDDAGANGAEAVLETRVAAALAGTLSRISGAAADEWRSTGILSAPIEDNLIEVGQLLSRFVSLPGVHLGLAELIALAPGERVERATTWSAVSTFAVEVEGYEGGRLTIAAR